MDGKESFSHRVKAELAELPPSDSERCISELAAITAACGSIGIVSIGYYIEFVGDTPLLKKRADLLIKKLYGAESDAQSPETGLKNQACVFRVTGDLAFSILTDCGVLYRDEEGALCLRGGIDRYLVMEEAQTRGYLAGAFMAAGSVAVPQDIPFPETGGSPTGGTPAGRMPTGGTPAGGGRGGYHFEIAARGAEFADGLIRLFGRFGIRAKPLNRPNKTVVYIKERDGICDALALLGASEAVLELNRLIAARTMRGRINRQTNCIEANIDKAVRAAARQTAAARALKAAGVLDTLPPALRELCELRLRYPELDLAGLAARTGKAVTKSGVSHRLKKIIAAADALRPPSERR